MKKKRQNFTIDRDLLKWLRSYASNESRTMSSMVNSLILECKRKQEGSPNEGSPKPRNVLRAND